MAELLADVQTDMNELIYKYSLKRNFSFNCFTETWNEMKFYYIFCGRSSVIEMKFFTQQILMMAKTMILMGISDWDKVGALYLMHALYYSQPLEKFVKIRIEQDELKEIAKVVKQLRAQCVDIAYAFFKLHSDFAFHFVATNVPRTNEKAGRVDLNKLNAMEIIETKAEKLKMLNIFKIGGVDEELWRNKEASYNETMKQVSELSCLPKPVKFTPNDLLKGFLLPENPPRVKPNKSKRKRKLTSYDLERIVSTGVECEDDELPPPEVSANSLPVINTDCH